MAERFANMHDERGQAMVETLLVIVIITSIAFAALQLCIMAVDDMLCNEAAFAGVRSAVVSVQSRASSNAADCSRMLLIPHFNAKNLMYEDTREWNDTILGNDIRDHNGRNIVKYNTNVAYRISLAFAPLIKPSLFGSPVIRHTARARMVKSPDEPYYFKAYPDAESFTGTNQ